MEKILDFVYNVFYEIANVMVMGMIGFILSLFVVSSDTHWQYYDADLQHHIFAVKYAIGIEDYYREQIPDEYFDLFWYYTRECPDLRPDILAIMKWESGDFRRSGYGPKNKNGSYDYGFMQINSYNLKNKWFVQKYGPKDRKYIRNFHDETIVMGINYYKEMHELYGENAFACYNGGPKADRILRSGENANSRFVKNVSTYQRYVSSIKKSILSDIDNISNVIVSECYDLRNIRNSWPSLLALVK